MATIIPELQFTLPGWQQGVVMTIVSVCKTTYPAARFMGLVG